jgi:hypothetical protein
MERIQMKIIVVNLNAKKIEPGIANLLVEKDIPKSDIVLAYFPPAHRKLTEFAEA